MTKKDWGRLALQFAFVAILVLAVIVAAWEQNAWFLGIDVVLLAVSVAAAMGSAWFSGGTKVYREWLAALDEREEHRRELVRHFPEGPS